MWPPDVRVGPKARRGPGQRGVGEDQTLEEGTPKEEVRFKRSNSGAFIPTAGERVPEYEDSRKCEDLDCG